MPGWLHAFHTGEAQGIHWGFWVGQISKGSLCSLQFKRSLNRPVGIPQPEVTPWADCFNFFIPLNLRRGTKVLKGALKQLLPWAQILCWVREVTFFIFTCTNAKPLPSLNFPDPFCELIAFQYSGVKSYIPSEQDIFPCPWSWQVLIEPAMQLGNAFSKGSKGIIDIFILCE